MPTMLKHQFTGEIYPYNPNMAKHPDMKPFDQPDPQFAAQVAADKADADAEAIKVAKKKAAAEKRKLKAAKKKSDELAAAAETPPVDEPDVDTDEIDLGDIDLSDA